MNPLRSTSIQSFESRKPGGRGKYRVGKGTLATLSIFVTLWEILGLMGKTKLTCPRQSKSYCPIESLHVNPQQISFSSYGLHSPLYNPTVYIKPSGLFNSLCNCCPSQNPTWIGGLGFKTDRERKEEENEQRFPHFQFHFLSFLFLVMILVCILMFLYLFFLHCGYWLLLFCVLIFCRSV